jgi:hypothetical protein
MRKCGWLVKESITMTTPINLSDGLLTIDALRVTDDVTVTYIGQLEPDAREAGVINCLQLGARALTFASDKTGASLLADAFKKESETAQSLLIHVSRAAQDAVAKSSERIEKATGELLDELTTDLGKSLDPANTESIVGKLRVVLVDDIQKVATKIGRELDLNNPQSPLATLRTELERSDERRYDALTKQVGELLRQSAERAAASAERSKSTRKGDDFEVATEEFLMAESAPRKDLVRRTSRDYGLDQNQVGDFVVDINPREAQDAHIVVESKNGQRGRTELVRELGKAMKNRAAAFGISVVTDPNIITQAIYPVGDDKLIVRVPALSENEWDFTALGVALEGARWKVIMGRVTTGTLNPARVKADIDAAFAITNRVAEVKKRITASKSQLDGIWEYLDDFKRELEIVLQRIKDTVSAVTQMPEAA